VCSTSLWNKLHILTPHGGLVAGVSLLSAGGLREMTGGGEDGPVACPHYICSTLYLALQVVYYVSSLTIGSLAPSALIHFTVLGKTSAVLNKTGG